VPLSGLGGREGWGRRFVDDLIAGENIAVHIPGHIGAGFDSDDLAVGQQQGLQGLMPVLGAEVAGDGLLGQVDGLHVVLDLVEQVERGIAAKLGFAFAKNIQIPIQLGQSLSGRGHGSVLV
jgi:hypothetical protein